MAERPDIIKMLTAMIGACTEDRRRQMTGELSFLWNTGLQLQARVERAAAEGRKAISSCELLSPQEILRTDMAFAWLGAIAAEAGYNGAFYGPADSSKQTITDLLSFCSELKQLRQKIDTRRPRSLRRLKDYLD